MSARPSRRDVLAGAGVTAAAVVGGAVLGRRHGAGSAPGPTAVTTRPATHTTSASPLPSAAATTPTPAASGGPDPAVVTAYNAEARLVAVYAAVVAGMKASTSPLHVALADHRRHLEALASAATTTVPGWVRPGPVAAPPGKPPTNFSPIEAAASAAMLALLPDAAGDVAGLLASIAGCEASHVLTVGIVRKVGAA